MHNEQNNSRDDSVTISSNLQQDICKECKQVPCVCPHNTAEPTEPVNEKTVSDEGVQSEKKSKRPKISWI